ncbi:hypothetical protein IB256_15435 [Pseudomonas sp. PDM17]|uniref:hypothetical protein n=1 Tax=Pseudomonas sp. PDM17 TaxID=2769285 RepID=UPI001782F712|nr:hypothetical protein [Pseudomonas sp. PDM17]MBD9502181.1 hypothetical protein [Pseudomonas sp. PDM17]
MSPEWVQFTLEFFENYIRGTLHGKKCKLRTRQMEWSNGIALIEEWKNTALMPKSVPIPSSRIRAPSSETHGSREQILGESIRRTKHSDVDISNKYILNMSYAQPLDIQLDEIHSEISRKFKVIKDIAIAHWNKVRECRRIGIELMSKITEQEINDALNDPNFSKNLKKRSNKYRVSVILAAARHQIFTNGVRPSITALSEHPFFDKNIARLFRVRIFEDTVRELTFGNMPKGSNLGAMLNLLLGIPFFRDFAAAATIITCDHPQFTATSLWWAKLLDKHEKSYVTIVGKNHGTHFEIEKKRAHAIKQAILSDISESVLHDIIETTQPMREILNQSNSHHAHMLFLSSDNVGFGIGSSVSWAMNGKKGASFYNLYEEEFLAAGLDRSSVCLSKIRATCGILNWFKTGSISSFAKTLGNTERVVMRSYMPTWLLNKYNERIIRRFQQMLIISSTAKSPVLLHATDFTNMTDLVKFIESSLKECRNNDPFSRAFVESVSGFSLPDIDESIRRNLAINLSVETVTLLYEINAWACKNPDRVAEADKLLPDELSVSALSSLAKLIETCSTNPPDSTQEYTINSNINGGSNYNLRQIHNQALLHLEQNQNLLNSLPIVLGGTN